MNHLVIREAILPDEMPAVCAIRYQVFQVEQGVAPELEFDGEDETARHWLVFLDEVPVGTARIRRLGDRIVKVERVAVLKQMRGLGIGQKIMTTILAVLTQEAIAEVWIHAQEPVRVFYQKLGFEPEGENFVEAGILHVKMRKRLTDRPDNHDAA